MGLARAHGYGAKFEEYRDWLPENGTVIVQIESIEGVNNLREIFSVEGMVLLLDLMICPLHWAFLVNWITH